jgi:hypothetical protein
MRTGSRFHQHVLCLSEDCRIDFSGGMGGAIELIADSEINGRRAESLKRAQAPGEYLARHRAINSQVGNLPCRPGIFPDYSSPIAQCDRRARDHHGECRLRTWSCWTKLESQGEPVDFPELRRLEPDSGVTNIRNTSSKHWQRWLGLDNRSRAFHVVLRTGSMVRDR